MSSTEYHEIQKKCEDFMAKRKRHELDESATMAAAKQLKHTAGLSAKEIQLISKKLSKLATMVYLSLSVCFVCCNDYKVDQKW